MKFKVNLYSRNCQFRQVFCGSEIDLLETKVYRCHSVSCRRHFVFVSWRHCLFWVISDLVTSQCKRFALNYFDEPKSFTAKYFYIIRVDLTQLLVWIIFDSKHVRLSKFNKLVFLSTWLNVKSRIFCVRLTGTKPSNGKGYKKRNVNEQHSVGERSGSIGSKQFAPLKRI